MSARNVEAIPDPVVSGDEAGGDQQLASLILSTQDLLAT